MRASLTCKGGFSQSQVRCLLIYTVNFLLQIKDKICRQCTEGCINKCVIIKYVTRYIILMCILKPKFGFIVPLLNKTGKHTNTCRYLPIIYYSYPLHLSCV